MGNDASAQFKGRYYSIERPKLGADLSYRFDSEDRKGPFTTAKNSTRVLNERFDLETEGWLYHPAMAAYTLRLSPEWAQPMSEADQGRKTTSKAFLLGYGLDLTLLPYKPYTVNLFARKKRSVLTSSLATQSESISDTFGATLNLKYRVLPTRLSYIHETSEQSGFYESREKRDELRLNMRHERKNNVTNFNASSSALDRTLPGSAMHTQNLFGNIQNNYRITPDNRILLSSNLNYRQSENALLKASGVSLSENLNWAQTKRFSTSYNFNYNQDAMQGTRVQRASAGAGLSHSLYENLITTASANASHSSGENAYGGNVNFNYQRRIPWGMIYASAGNDYRVTTRSLGQTLVPVPSEPQVFTTGNVTLLGNKNVDLATVVVTNATGDVTYMRDIDYTLQLVGTSVRISRNAFGSIADGQSVRVSYSYLSNPAFDDAVYGQNFGLGFYLWSAWRINYRYSHSRQGFLAGIQPDVLNESTRHTADSDFKWKWSTTRLFYEDTQTTSGISTNRWRLEESLNFRPSKTTFVGASAHYGETILKEVNARDSFRGYRGDLQWLLSYRSKVRVEGLYAVMEGTSVNMVDKGLGALWEWSYGIWKADASYRFLNQEDRIIGQSRNRHSVFFSIRRTLY